MFTLIFIFQPTTYSRASESSHIVGENESSRIVGGQIVKEGTFPYMVWLKQQKGGLFCGATYLGDNRLLTAASCFNGILENSQTYAVLGDYDRETVTGNEQTILVDRVVEHPGYDDVIGINNIAIVYLTETPPGILPVKLPESENITAALNSLNRPIPFTIIGWGRSATEEPATNLLYGVDLNFFPHRKCVEKLPFTVSKKVFCGLSPMATVQTPVAPCKGDVGGPALLKNENEEFIQIGVFSTNAGCATPFQNVFTDVGIHLDFINNPDSFTDMPIQFVRKTDFVSQLDMSTTVPAGTYDYPVELVNNSQDESIFITHIEVDDGTYIFNPCNGFLKPEKSCTVNISVLAVGLEYIELEAHTLRRQVPAYGVVAADGAHPIKINSEDLASLDLPSQVEPLAREPLLFNDVVVRNQTWSISNGEVEARVAPGFGAQSLIVFDDFPKGTLSFSMENKNTTGGKIYVYVNREKFISGFHMGAPHDSFELELPLEDNFVEFLYVKKDPFTTPTGETAVIRNMEFTAAGSFGVMYLLALIFFSSLRKNKYSKY